MARTYDLTALSPVDPKSVTWAVAWVRAAIRDTPNDAGAFPAGGYHDEELQAAIELDVIVDGADRYYRPHVTAAGLVSGDPTRVLSFSGGSYSERYEDGAALRRALLKRGEPIDALIEDATDGRFSGASTTFRVVF